MNFNTVFLSLGSNIGQKKANLDKALSYLDNMDFEILKKSALYKTEAIGPQQEDYLNMVVKARTALSPYDLLSKIKLIETKIGRKKSFQWGPRLIDIDILSYQGVSLNLKELSLPHSQMLKRRFVLEPLYEIEKNYSLINQNHSLRYFLNLCLGQRCEKV